MDMKESETCFYYFVYIVYIFGGVSTAAHLRLDSRWTGGPFLAVFPWLFFVLHYYNVPDGLFFFCDTMFLFSLCFTFATDRQALFLYCLFWEPGLYIMGGHFFVYFLAGIRNRRGLGMAALLRSGYMIYPEDCLVSSG